MVLLFPYSYSLAPRHYPRQRLAGCRCHRWRRCTRLPSLETLHATSLQCAGVAPLCHRPALPLRHPMSTHGVAAGENVRPLRLLCGCGAAVDAYFHLQGRFTHFLLGREGNLRCFQGILRGYGLGGVHHLG